MIRRIILAGGALVAVASLSSCTTFSRSDAVAEVNGQELSLEQLSAITGGTTDGDTARNAINGWLTLAIIGGDIDDIQDTTDLQARGQAALDALAEPFADEARVAYEQGIDGSPVLCIGAIPLPETTDPSTVIAELDRGATLADTAAKYSNDATLRQNGGLVVDQNNNNCLDPAGFNPDLITALGDAGAAPGTPVALDLGAGQIVVLLRPFDDLSSKERVLLVPQQMSDLQKSLLDASEIYVSPRFGRWDPATVSVVPLVSG